jgi:hypothetical protein
VSATTAAVDSSTSLGPPATTTPSPTPPVYVGLSTGAKAGIGVGVSLLAMLALAFIIVFVRRQKRAVGAFSASGISTHDGKPELDGSNSIVQAHEKAELDAAELRTRVHLGDDWPRSTSVPGIVAYQPASIQRKPVPAPGVKYVELHV